MATYTTGEMSDRTGLSIPTLRYYEQIGLLDPVDRAENGHRRYSDDDLRRVEFLKRVRATGMSIREIQHYVNLYRAGHGTLDERLDILEQHRQAVRAQMEALEDTLDFLDMKITRYQQDIHTTQTVTDR